MPQRGELMVYDVQPELQGGEGNRRWKVDHGDNKMEIGGGMVAVEVVVVAADMN
jgi:hypothetical protein